MKERHELYAARMRAGRVGRALSKGIPRKPMGRAVRIAEISPEVLLATADELIACGWGDHNRDRIPADWRRVG